VLISIALFICIFSPALLSIIPMKKYLSIFSLAALLIISACGEGERSFPVGNTEDVRREKRGKITGEGLVIGGGGQEEEQGNSPIGVNSFLWQATLDTFSFMPLASADPFGGVILTEWYEDPEARGERYKTTTLILGRSLRADGIRVSVFKQILDKNGNWRDLPVDKSLSREIEDTILTRARQLRINSAR
jgi:hypothetical protein